MTSGSLVRGIRLIALISSALTVLGGCSSKSSSASGPFVAHRVDYQEDAGSVDVSVLSVAPWEKYYADLQPKFEMTAARALEEVLPTTQKVQHKTLRAVSEVMKLGLPNTTKSEVIEEVIRRGAENSSDSTSKVTRSRKPGDLDNVSLGDPPQGDRTTDAIKSLGDLDKEELGHDPMTRYSAATALYQEVRLLNRYVSDAATRRGFVPYVVRLQLSLLPRARHAPYDVDTYVSFFENDRPRVRTSALKGPGQRDIWYRTPWRPGEKEWPTLGTDQRNEIANLTVFPGGDGEGLANIVVLPGFLKEWKRKDPQLETHWNKAVKNLPAVNNQKLDAEKYGFNSVVAQAETEIATAADNHASQEHERKPPSLARVNESAFKSFTTARPDKTIHQVPPSTETKLASWAPIRTLFESWTAADASKILGAHEAGSAQAVRIQELVFAKDLGRILRSTELRDSGFLVKFELFKQEIRDYARAKSPTSLTEAGIRYSTPVVVPLLVTESLEGSLGSYSANDVRQMGFALQGIIDNLGLGFDHQKFLEDLKSVLGRDLNALLTLSRTNENTLRVRLGAMRQAQASYAMVPRSHTVTTLVLVPKQASHSRAARQIRVQSRSVMTDAESGKQLPVSAGQNQNQHLNDILRKYGSDVTHENRAVLRSLLRWVDLALWRHFELELALLARPEFRGRHEELWTDLTTLGALQDTSWTTFDVQSPQEPILPPLNQLLELRDDGKAEMTATLNGGRDLAANHPDDDRHQLWARLLLAQGTDYKTEECEAVRGGLSTVLTSRPIPWIATRIETNGELERVTVHFPSLRAAGGVPMSASKTCVDLKLDLGYGETPGGGVAANNTATTTYANVYYRLTDSTEQEKALAKSRLGFSLAHSPRVVMNGNGEGTLTLEFSKIDKTGPDVEIACKIQGADIAELSGGTKSGQWTFGASTSEQAVELSLRNLVKGTKVTLVAKNTATKAEVKVDDIEVVAK